MSDNSAVDTVWNKFARLPEYMRKKEWLFCVLLAVITFLAYVPAWNGRPIGDDETRLVPLAGRSLNGLEHIWIQPGTTMQYHPLVGSVFWVEARLWGNAMPGYHLVNIALHVAAALLLLKILQALEIRGAWLAASVFALHPVQVESVAWLVELKNTLSAVFFMAAVLAWLRFERVRSRETYALVMALFLLGLMAKTIVALLPLVLMVVLWWRRGKISWKEDVWPLVPFLVIGLVAGFFTSWMERKFSGAEGGLFNLSFTERYLVAGRAFWFYLGKLFWPANLMFNYPRWNINAADGWQYWYPRTALLLFAAVGGAWRWHKLRAPLAGLLLFAILLFPLSGFFNVYYFTFSFVADHFQYLAGISVITLVSAGVALSLEKLKGRALLAGQGACVTLVLVLAVLTARQSRMYANPKTAYLTTIERNPESWMAHDNLGNILMQEGRVDDAIDHYRQALRIRPDSAKTACNLGVALLQKGNTNEATACFQKAIAAKPDYAQAYNNLGNALLKLRRVPEAVACYRKAIKIDSGYADAHANLAGVLLDAGHPFESISQYQQALKIHPDSPEIENSLGVAFLKTGKTDEAINHYQAALNLRPDYGEAHNNMGIALLKTGRVVDAVSEFQKAIATPPGHANAQNNLAWIFATWPDAKMRNGAKSIELATKLNDKARGRNPLILTTLAAGYAETGKFAEAKEIAHRAMLLAEDEKQPMLVRALKIQIAAYESNQPFRDNQK